MAFRRRPPPAHRRALVASGKAIRLDDATLIAQYRRRYAATRVWQTQATYFSTVVPIIGFAQDYVRDSMSRIGVFPAILGDDPKEEPVALDEETAPDGLDPDLPLQILSRLEPFPDFMGRTAQQLDKCGEGHVALILNDDDIDGEECRVLSVDELFTKDGKWFVRDDIQDTQGQPLLLPGQDAPNTDADHPPLICSPGGFFRIWTPDSTFVNQPDSPMRRLLTESDTLLLLLQLLRGLARSRIAMSGRILAIADEFSLMSAVDHSTEDAGDGEARTDPFIEDVMAAATAAMLDPESPAAGLPLMIRGPRDLLKDGIVSIDLERPIDQTTLEWRNELRNEIANGLNLPKEVILGIGETNHWNKEEIRQQTWEVHLEPRAMNILAAVTQAFLRPQLIAEGVDPEIARRVIAHYDPSAFLGNPDLSETAQEAFDSYAISWEAYRRARGWSEDDAPDEDEVKIRLWIAQQEKVTIREQVENPSGATVEGPPSGEGDQPVDEATPTEEHLPAKPPPGAKPGPEAPAVPDTPQKNAPKPAASLVAAGKRQKIARLGGRQAQIERDLRTWVQTEANAALARQLERAGGKVRAAADRKKARIMEQIRTLPAADVAATVGRAGVKALGLDSEDLIAGAFAAMEPRYLAKVTAAQKAALRAAAEASGGDYDPELLDAEMADHRTAGWGVLAAGLGALLAGALYNPHPEAPPLGEFDPTSLVPMGMVRSSLSTAGGAAAPTIPSDLIDPADLNRIFSAPSVDETGGATGGPAMSTIYSDSLGIEAATHTWTTGDPDRPFEPHQELDGIEFQDWDDPRLANDADFPPVDFYIPGDHAGCLCDVETTFTLAGESAEEAA